MKVLIKNARVITPFEVLDDHWVLVRDGSIAEVKKGREPGENFDLVVDAGGNYLSPGFIDIHNHGSYGRDFMEATPGALETIAEFHLKNGVTGFLATVLTAPFEEMKRAIKNAAGFIKIQGPDKARAKLLGIYVEGPYFSTAKRGAQPAEYIRKPDTAELDELLRLSENSIRVVALAPEAAGAEDAISFLRERGIVAAMGHTNATYDEAKRGIDLGVTLVTHTFNGMRGFDHREPGAAGAALTDERVYCEVICDGIHLHPAAVRLILRAKGKDRIVLVSDAMMACGLSDGEYTLAGQKVIVRNGEARLQDGTLAGSTLTLDRAVRYMVRTIGVSLCEAVRMASLNPAGAIGLSQKKGSIEVGKDADMIIFDDEIRVKWAMVEGVPFSFSEKI
ncbi:N-acetylglucosamine-6-phosphate deacetylase [Thermosediminibacter oceani]|uniref:N-acetylglucosamine-6-phosphate deacetylase n=1 Tax=Thermosediminibacter oceani (strain ATCC BAA-1034 / DSM 16646 / JW/IW-1228P) TaxID=555079 RepID=D9S0U4_THEOJ|nr:N-acetylglucosamine-6-phosphate deacetylase [Thermosediminibacter oceani]ADL07108.1 N-acetylglucosamine-6-phosphate deacetylase [Thermosediminibacter oceani DSM 16646]